MTASKSARHAFLNQKDTFLDSFRFKRRRTGVMYRRHIAVPPAG